jgi:hypothetical protein
MGEERATRTTREAREERRVCCVRAGDEQVKENRVGVGKGRTSPVAKSGAPTGGAAAIRGLASSSEGVSPSGNETAMFRQRNAQETMRADSLASHGRASVHG